MNIKPLGLLAFALLTACDKPIEPPPPPRPALVMKVGATATETAMSLVGEIRPRYESAQGFRIKGKIIERKVEMGTPVKKGQLMVRLDAADTNLSTTAALADVRAAEASYALAVTELNRQRQLFAKKFISASALDSREAELKTASAKLAQVKAQANVTANQTQYTHLTADRDGVVTMIRAEPGQVVDEGEIIVKIADTRAIDVLVAVPESRMGDVKLNATVTVRLWADRAKAYAGIVREMSPAADSATRAFNVRVTLKDADAAIKLGMTAGVKFTQQDELSRAEWLIPNSALTEINGQKTVWVIDANNKAQPRAVVTGPFREDGVLIVSGLQGGEKIAIAGVHALVKDQIVKPVLEHGVKP
ncbi:MAG: efflux RND transporter periplasmic adaptor subunit [Methylococcaceae bacterium]|nr:efflux RND transporter periplasmic adaptor subunit [Methylococcaceae bacterium]